MGEVLDIDEDENISDIVSDSSMAVQLTRVSVWVGLLSIFCTSSLSLVMASILSSNSLPSFPFPIPFLVA